MTVVDASGGIWVVGKPRWRGSRRWVPFGRARDFLPADGLGGDIADLVVLVFGALVAGLVLLVSTMEYLAKLLARPIRLLVQPSARRAGWQFDVVEFVPAEADVTSEIVPVPRQVCAPTRTAKRDLRAGLVAQLRTGRALATTARTPRCPRAARRS
ncbi:hypothetical protein [Amycolatopsis sp. CA-230715]|uniref:hypothetical protein n=1 Tax=Amycolatopsis sp. CA-230715 TaxID=2745196 RepID=UPI001C016E28|nr:hypothetical protein [Amycolatopsis sp. CA-230715]